MEQLFKDSCFIFRVFVTAAAFMIAGIAPVFAGDISPEVSPEARSCYGDRSLFLVQDSEPVSMTPDERSRVIAALPEADAAIAVNYEIAQVDARLFIDQATEEMAPDGAHDVKIDAYISVTTAPAGKRGQDDGATRGFSFYSAGTTEENKTVLCTAQAAVEQYERFYYHQRETFPPHGIAFLSHIQTSHAASFVRVQIAVKENMYYVPVFTATPPFDPSALSREMFFYYTTAHEKIYRVSSMAMPGNFVIYHNTQWITENEDETVC